MQFEDGFHRGLPVSSSDCSEDPDSGPAAGAAGKGAKRMARPLRAGTAAGRSHLLIFLSRAPFSSEAVVARWSAKPIERAMLHEQRIERPQEASCATRAARRYDARDGDRGSPKWATSRSEIDARSDLSSWIRLRSRRRRDVKRADLVTIRCLVTSTNLVRRSSGNLEIDRTHVAGVGLGHIGGRSPDRTPIEPRRPTVRKRSRYGGQGMSVKRDKIGGIIVG